eukprot:TRINITY_DN4002_c0_g1_i10.p1 TRINITY_DN4002_c0_g1~~TRINITY_DN4002_c0_g1_i10.p1  ORF type:complete len:337 (+),score=79.45 TRINITY_DN4002_c0_g1_i10:877-1887(+)
MLSTGKNDLINLVFGRSGCGKSTAVADFVAMRQNALSVRLRPAQSGEEAIDRKKQLDAFCLFAQTAISLARSPTTSMLIHRWLWSALQYFGSQSYSRELPQQPLLVIDEVEEAFLNDPTGDALHTFASWVAGLVSDQREANVLIVSNDGLFSDRLQGTALKTDRTVTTCFEPFALDDILKFAASTDPNLVKQYWVVADGNMRDFNSLLSGRESLDREIRKFAMKSQLACRSNAALANKWSDAAKNGLQGIDQELFDFVNQFNLGQYDACTAQVSPLMQGALSVNCAVAEQRNVTAVMLNQLRQFVGLEQVPNTVESRIIQDSPPAPSPQATPQDEL